MYEVLGSEKEEYSETVDTSDDYYACLLRGNLTGRLVDQITPNEMVNHILV